MIDKNEKTMVIVSYALIIFGFGLVSLIIALLKKGDGTPAASSHYLNIISMILWYVLWGLIGAVLTIIGIGLLILLAISVLAVVRIVMGLVDAFEGDPYRRNPKAAFI